MEEYLKKVKDANNYLLNTWIPSGQSFEDKEVERVVTEILGDEKVEVVKQFGFSYKSGANGEEMVYDQAKFEAADALTKELALQLYYLDLIVGEAYNPERLQFKFIRELKAKNGFN